eukprot:TRINITY_DN15325_c0_g1_i1.p2 TRINITY_DN15325_c0_g1~~TRINITY_DN15325_c0_g1_i1.p2  ORF type:complete len:284 (+),score=61.67 TRINITY_DN15325_c0_g1_i1:73-852(+)
MLQIFAACDGDGAAPLPIELAADACVRDAEDAVSAAVGHRIHVLSWQGEPLRDPSAQLADLGICPEAVLHFGSAPTFRWGKCSSTGTVNGTVWEKTGGGDGKESIALSQDPIPVDADCRGARYQLRKLSGTGASAQLGVCVADCPMDVDFCSGDMHHKAWYWFDSSLYDGNEQVGHLECLSDPGSEFILHMVRKQDPDALWLTIEVRGPGRAEQDPDWTGSGISRAITQIDAIPEQPIHLFVSHYYQGDAWEVVKYEVF